MLIRFIHWFASKLRRRDICGEDGTLYLSRYKVVGWMPGDTRRWPFSIYLHHFHRPDLDDAPHSHPWRWAVALILSGGYRERRGEFATQDARYRRLGPGALNVIRADDFHVVLELLGRETWTLFVVGPKTSSWGFKVAGRVIPSRERLRERGIEPSY
jgi:hypothetical protein